MFAEKEKKRASVAQFFTDKMRAYPRHLVSLLAFSAVANVAILAPSFHMMQVYDRVLSSYSYATLISITAAAILALCVYGIADTARLRLAQRLAAAFTQDYSKRIFVRASGNPDKSPAIERLRDFQMARMFLASKPYVALFDLPFIPLFLFLILFVHPTLFFVTLVGIAAIVVAGLFSHAATRETKQQTKFAEHDLTMFGQNVIGAVVPAASMGLLPNLLPAWERKIAYSLQTNEQASAKQCRLYSLAKVIRQIIQVSTMAWGAFLVIHGDMSGGLIFLASMLSGKALAPIEQAIGALEQIEAGIDADMRLRSAMDMQEETAERSFLPPPSGDLQMHGVVALDNRQRPILNSVNGRIRRGQCLAISGPSGSGKSTLLALIAGVRQPHNGAVTLDRIDQRNWPIRQWGEIAGYCPERGGLHRGTVVENVSRFAENPNQQQVYTLLTRLGIHAQIMDLPQQYQTVIDDSTQLLSAAQIRLLLIARATYASPQLLVVDRPEVYLDDTAQQAVAELFAEMKAQGTSIIMCTQSKYFFALTDRRVEIAGGSLREVPTTPQTERERTNNPRKVAADHDESVPA